MASGDTADREHQGRAATPALRSDGGVPGAGTVLRGLGANAGRALRRTVARFALPRRRRFWLRLRLGPGLGEQRPVGLLGGREAHLSLLDALRALDVAAADPQVEGVVLRLAGGPPGFAGALALRRALDAVAQAGKSVVAWGETLRAEDLLLAGGATRLHLPEAGTVQLVGLRIEGFFLRDLLVNLGIEPEVVRIGSFKTAAEGLTRGGMSPEQREQLEALLDDQYQALVEGIARGRGLDPEQVRGLVDRGPFTARDAREAGLVDDPLYPDEVEKLLEQLSAGPDAASSGQESPRVVDLGAYHALRATDPGWTSLLRERPRFAYVTALGSIHRGGGPRGVALDVYRALLERLGRDRRVRGLVLRVDSPGGDALASDLIWRCVERVRQEKPVVVSMADVAASGGYYVAAGADAILAEAGTVTGSIGVVGGKLNVGPLYERIGVAKDGVQRGARAGLLSESRGFTPDERSSVRDGMASIYELFLRRVGEGRDLERSELERVAQGRVWSGARALEIGLVDALGGPLEALLEVRRRAGLDDHEPFHLDVHPATPRLSRLLRLARRLPRRVDVGSELP